MKTLASKYKHHSLNQLIPVFAALFEKYILHVSGRISKLTHLLFYQIGLWNKKVDNSVSVWQQKLGGSLGVGISIRMPEFSTVCDKITV